MTKKPIIAKIEFYSFLVAYFMIIDQILEFSYGQLKVAESFADQAWRSIPVSDTSEAAKLHREDVAKMRTAIKSHLRDVESLSAKIEKSINYCKEKENECSITVRSIKHKS